MTAPVPATPDSLTLAMLAKWDGTEMRRQMAHPEMREAITNLLKNRTLADVEAAARVQEQPIAQAIVIPEDAADAATAEAARVEAERVQAEAAAEAAKPKKVAIDYQVRDEDGNPIGRPTHLEATSEEELRTKLIEAHTQATRAFHRLKKQKTTFKQPEQTPVVQQPLTDQELQAAISDIRSDDPKKSSEAQAKVTLEERRKAREAAELYRQEQVSYNFLRNHMSDFNNCKANVDLIADYVKENQLDWTIDNLELAFTAKELELAPVVVRPVAPAAPVNPVAVVPPVVPAPAAPAVTAPAAQPVVQPTVTAPAPTAPPANPVVPAPRPGVNGGIVPGQNSGVRPVAKSTGLTAEEIRSWDGPTMRKKMANPATRAQIEKFLADRKLAK